MANLRNRLVDHLGLIDQGKRMAVDFSTHRAVVTPRVAMAACIVTVVLTLGAIAAVVWTSTPQISMLAVQDAAVAGSTSETTETLVEMRDGPRQETNPQAQAGPLIVSVVGLVVSPGVAEVPAGTRVVRATDRAGGLLSKTNPASANLATPLADGQQIVVGTEAFLAGMAEDGADVSGGLDAGAADIVSPGDSDGEVDTNTASATQLEGLPGVGPVTVAKTTDFREKDGVFASIDALEEIPGTDPTKVEAPRNAATI